MSARSYALHLPQTFLFPFYYLDHILFNNGILTTFMIYAKILHGRLIPANARVPNHQSKAISEFHYPQPVLYSKEILLIPKGREVD